jgi:MoxR-like ATPase
MWGIGNMSENKTIKKLDELKGELKKVIIGRDDIIDSLVLALASNEHILIIGKHGEAKSYAVNTLNKVTKLNSFSVQLHRETTLKDIVGLINPAEFQKGNLDLIKTKFWNANIFFCDEFLRARSEFLDFLLEVMVERKTTKTILGERNLPIISVIATTNPLTEEYNTERLDLALKDRFFSIIDVKHMVEENKREEITKILNDATGNGLKLIDLTADELIALKEEAKKIIVDDGIIVELFIKLKDESFLFSTRTIKLFKHVLQTHTMLKGKETATEEEFLHVSKLMLKNRYDKLTADKIDDIVDECLIYLDNKAIVERLQEINKLRVKAEELNKDGKEKEEKKALEVFVEKSADIFNETKEDYANYPKRLKDMVITLTKDVKKVLIQEPTLVSDKLLKKLDTERFKDVFEIFIEGKTIETGFLNQGQMKECHNIVKNIKYCHVTERHTEGYTKYIVSPIIDNPKSLLEIARVEKELEEKKLLTNR